MTETAYVLEMGKVSSCRHLGALHPRCLRSREAIREAVRSASRRSLWICMAVEPAYWLAEVLSQVQTARRGCLLALADIPGPLASVLSAGLERFVPRQRTMLPLNELAAVLASEDCGDFCIGGSVVERAGIVALVRGDLSLLTVPFSDFPAKQSGVVPDFGRFEVADHGRTLRFGSFEAALDAVLYERDAAYRRRVKAGRLAQDDSLGGSLRRLRLQRGLRLADFGPMEKAVARIERGEVRVPRRSTLAVIARKLGVEPEQIREF